MGGSTYSYIQIISLYVNLTKYHNGLFVHGAVEIATLTRVREEGADRDKTQIRVLPAEEVNDIIKVYNEKEEARKREEKAKEERAKQTKEAAPTSSTS